MIRTSFAALLALLLALLAGCERPPIEAVQHGYRGTGMVLMYNPRTVADQVPLNQPPASTPAAPADGPKAGQVYQNVKVLGDLSVAEFTRTMTSMAAWVAPTEGCAYCHNLQNLADDSKYQKVVSRRMLEMTRHVNADWKQHVAATGVTCWTCHRGQNIPQQVWFRAQPQDQGANFIGDLAGQNLAAKTVGLSSLPFDPFTPYLKDQQPIRVVSTTALPTGNPATIKGAEQTYGLMMHMSSALGVNCTFCHNANSFLNWDNVPPQRATAYHGIRMARDLNGAYLEPLTGTFPASRLGPTGDVAKVNCATCHQGAYKPVYGAQMAKDYPALVAAPAPAEPASAAAAAAAPEPAASAAVTAAAPALPDPVADAKRSVLYFGVGSSKLDSAQAKGLEQLIDALAKSPKLTASISGYHSASGQLAANQDLAKKRAFSVRDALVAAGIPDKRVKLQKPQSAEANLAGEDPASRRVEVTLK